MKKRSLVGLTLANPLRLVIGVILLILAGWASNANAQTVTILYSFGSSPNDGAYPNGELVQGSDGNFYGTTDSGGHCCGTVFRISPSGSCTNLYSFGGSPKDGLQPVAGLVQGSDGNFYGTTYQGGTSTNCYGGGCGTVFRISPSGNYTSLYSFVGYPNDGFQPDAQLVQGGDGNFYGTTLSGGTSTNCNYGCGTVFRISPSGTYTTLYSFGSSSPNNGYSPRAGLVQGSDGNLYGTTEWGGTTNMGTVFRISPSGTYTNLHSFIGYSTDGAEPLAGLVLGGDGYFYGTTGGGGTNFDDGTVFRISPSGSYTNLYSFGGSPHDGYSPQGGLVQGSDGNFYGTTTSGGTSTYCTDGGGCGTVFRISPSGSYTNLYSFGGSPSDGAIPYARLVQGSDGNFYGTTEGGGYCCGTVFKLTVPFKSPPYPINQVTSVRIAGTNLIFAIPSIAGESYQLQYRSSMTSGIWSNVPGVSVTNSIGSILTLTNFAGANQPQGFYRFAITP